MASAGTSQVLAQKKLTDKGRLNVCHGPVDLLQRGIAVEDKIDAGHEISEGEEDDADIVEAEPEA